LTPPQTPTLFPHLIKPRTLNRRDLDVIRALFPDGGEGSTNLRLVLPAHEDKTAPDGCALVTAVNYNLTQVDELCVGDPVPAIFVIRAEKPSPGYVNLPVWLLLE
jgi:hypothetical protein